MTLPVKGYRLVGYTKHNDKWLETFISRWFTRDINKVVQECRERQKSSDGYVWIFKPTRKNKYDEEMS